MRHSASTGSPRGPRTRAVRTRPPRASSVPSPPSATGTSSHSQPVPAAAAGTVDADGFRFRMLAIDPDAYRMAYDVVSNGTLWFLHHALWDLARRPRFDRRWREAWDAYRAVNHTFARAVIDEAPQDAI